MGNLTALAVKAANKPGRYQDGNGLMLLVKESGARSWVLRLQADGKRRDFGLGPFVDLGLADARAKADTIRKQFRGGIDPVEAKREAKAARAIVPTFAEAARQAFDEQKAGWRNAKHRAQWLASLEAYAFPSIGKVRVNKVDSPMIRDTLLAIWLEKPETARRVRQRIATVLDWSHAKGFRDSEAPMRSVTKGLPRQPKKDGHHAAIPHPELPAMMAKLATSGGMGALALRFAVLTAARSGEVRGASWGEIDLDAKTWTLPAGRMKAGKEHVVPLSDTALELVNIAALTSNRKANAPVFPGMGGKIMSDMTLAKALKTAGGSAFTVHGMRSAFRDWAAEMTGTPGDVVEAALAHTIANRVEAAYRRTNYLDKRRVLMAAWANYLTERPANVVALRA